MESETSLLVLCRPETACMLLHVGTLHTSSKEEEEDEWFCPHGKINTADFGM